MLRATIYTEEMVFSFYDQKLKKILNEDQYKKYQMRNMRRGFRGGARPNGPQLGRRPEGQFQGPRMEAPKAE